MDVTAAEKLVFAMRQRVIVEPDAPAGDGRAAARQLDAVLMGAGFKCSRQLTAGNQETCCASWSPGNLAVMRGPVQSALRWLTRVTRPLALRSAGSEGSSTSVVRHVGRRTGRGYQTPVVAVEHDGSFLIALPYGERTDWLKNVLAKGSATLVTGGRTYQVDKPEVIPMAEATGYFQPKEQRMHRRFGVDSALRVRRVPAGATGPEVVT